MLLYQLSYRPKSLRTEVAYPAAAGKDCCSPPKTYDVLWRASTNCLPSEALAKEGATDPIVDSLLISHENFKGWTKSGQMRLTTESAGGRM